MAVLNEKFIISSSGNNSLVDITEKIKGIAQNCEATNAIINICTKNPYSSVVTLDYKKGLSEDFLKYMKDIAPINWKQDNVSCDDSVFAYIRALIAGRNLILPITNRVLELSEGQRIVVADFNILSSEIEIITSLIT